jgi:hypothetical protein
LIAIALGATVSVTLNSKDNLKPIDPSLGSFSFEWPGVPIFFGQPGKLKLATHQLLQNLKDLTGKGAVIRVGANSAQTSWWNKNNETNLPDGINYTIKPGDLLALDAAAQAIGGKLIFGVNFRKPYDATLAIDEVKAFSSVIGWNNTFAIEIGNEPDLFKLGLRPGWGPYDYKAEWEYMVHQIQATNLLPSEMFFQGATYCCMPDFMDNFNQHMIDEAAVCKSYSVHAYPLSACDGAHPKLESLLQDDACSKMVSKYKTNVNQAIALGKKFAMGEGNSVVCGGAANVSDTFGSALWGIDWLFNWANIGASNVNFHMAGLNGNGDSFNKKGFYSAFAFDNAESQIPEVRPLYYGILFFAQAAGGDSVILPMTTESADNQIKVWAVYDKTTATVRVAVINKNMAADAPSTVSVTLNQGLFANYSTTATLARLKAASPYSHTGITLAGQTFDGSLDGKPVGNRQVSSVALMNGAFSFSIDAASAALIEIPKWTAQASSTAQQSQPTVPHSTARHSSVASLSASSTQASQSQTAQDSESVEIQSNPNADFLKSANSAVAAPCCFALVALCSLFIKW